MSARKSNIAGTSLVLLALAAGCSQSESGDQQTTPGNAGGQAGAGGTGSGAGYVVPGDPEMPGVIEVQDDAGTSGFELIGIRTSNGGKRRLVLRKTAKTR